MRVWKYMPAVLLITVLVCLGLVDPARAGCVGVGCSCDVTAAGVDFGSYNPLGGGPVDAAGSVSVQCSALALGAVVSYTVALGPGGGGSMGAREMDSGAGTLSYNFYRDPARTLVWGDGTLGTGLASNAYLLDLLLFRVTDFTVHGRLPAGQNVPAGTYTDTIPAMVVF